MNSLLSIIIIMSVFCTNTLLLLHVIGCGLGKVMKIRGAVIFHNISVMFTEFYSQFYRLAQHRDFERYAQICGHSKVYFITMIYIVYIIDMFLIVYLIY